jgi:4-amino-4-deoxy-L-arabinose transferase-like glycosyltransferase
MKRKIYKYFKKDYTNVLLVLIVLAGAVLRLPLLNSYPMERDEFARVVPEFSLTSLVPPGFLFLIKLSAYLFKYSDLGYRLPVYIFGVSSIILIYYLGKTFFGKIEGLLASFMLAGFLKHISSSNQTKEYVPLMFFTILSTILVYKILFEKDNKKTLYPVFIMVSLVALLLSSYFHFLVTVYQVIIIISVTCFRNRFRIKDFLRSIGRSQKYLFLTLGMMVSFTFLSWLVWQAFNSYFGVHFIWPEYSTIANYFHEMAYFVTRDKDYAHLTEGLLLLGLVVSLFLSRYRKGYLYLVAFGALDIFLVSGVKFAHAAFPFHYPRYHSFWLPLYIVAIAASVGGLSCLARKTVVRTIWKLGIRRSFLIAIVKTSVAGLILILFVGYNLKHMIPMIRWYYTLPEQVVMNFKDAGRYLTFNMKRGDTLVRLKNFSMEQKFNHVNHYLDPTLFLKINYSIFPERTSKNNWYVPLRTGDEDPWGFSDWLVVEKIRPSLEFQEPCIWKLDYFGPLVATRKIENKTNWRASSTISGGNLAFAFDGNEETVWGGPIKTGDYFLLDLGRSQLINSINYNFNQYFPQNFTLWVSQDGTSWQNVFSLTTPGFNTYNFSKIFFKPTDVRFIKLEFIVDPLTINKRVETQEIEVLEVYEKNIGINRESVFNAEPVKRFNFSDSPEGWFSGEGITNLRVEGGELRGQIFRGNAKLEVPLPSLLENSSRVNLVNFALKVDRGKYATVGLKTKEETLWIREIEIEPDNLSHYYSLNLDDSRFLENLRERIEGVIFVPSDEVGAEFGLDFFSLDQRNLPGIQVADQESPNGLAQMIPYDPEVDYIFNQFGERLELEKGEYLAHFKIKADSIDPDWKEKLKPRPNWRLYSYIESKDVSDSDILYISLETTRGTFYESAAYLNVHGEIFQEAGKYYEFSMRFKADGREKLFFQAWSPRHRRYPANLYITFPEIEKIK